MQVHVEEDSHTNKNLQKLRISKESGVGEIDKAL